MTLRAVSKPYSSAKKRLTSLSHWQGILVCLIAGVASSFSLPPFGFWPVLLVSYPVLVWAIDGLIARSAPKNFWTAFSIGWSFAFGYYAASLYWIGHAFLVEAQTFAWLLPLAVLAMPAGLAVFWGLATSLAARLWRQDALRIVILTLSIALAEWLRGHVFTGFPWNAPGYAGDVSITVLQITSLTGLYGLTLLVLLWAMLPAVLADRYGPGIILSGIVVFGAVYTFGAVRLAAPPTGSVAGVTLRVVQPNIPQKEKWVRGNRDAIINRYLDLSRSTTEQTGKGLPDVTHLIWPESALPLVMTSSSGILGHLAGLLPGNTTLLTGSLRLDEAARQRKVYNSVLVIGSDGRIQTHYDKHRLVPFGEYLPLADVLEPMGLRQVVPVPLGFAAGNGPAVLKLENGPALGPLICYEAIFPGQVVSGETRPEWLLQVTNDGWFGTSIGPHQHLAQARMRAVEEGLPLVRAANTGISAVIDSSGRYVHRLELGIEGYFDSSLPAPLPPTVFARYADLVFWLVFATIAFICWISCLLTGLPLCRR